MENKTIDMKLWKLTNQSIEVLYRLRKRQHENDRKKLMKIGEILKKDIEELKK